MCFRLEKDNFAQPLEIGKLVVFPTQQVVIVCLWKHPVHVASERCNRPDSNSTSRLSPQRCQAFWRMSTHNLSCNSTGTMSPEFCRRAANFCRGVSLQCDGRHSRIAGLNADLFPCACFLGLLGVVTRRGPLLGSRPSKISQIRLD